MTTLLSTFRFLQCPLCRKSLTLNGLALTCENKHSFDVSRQGYANFLNKRVKTKYDKKLFVSRRNITLGGFFYLLAENLAEIISLKFKNKTTLTILDCGCGEGTLFAKIINAVGKKIKNIDAIGIDISKDGVKLAAGKNKNMSWIVADLANIALKNKSSDIILNILSPANYAEFKRCVKSGGLILKVIPAKAYLQEIRKAFNKPQDGDKSVKKLFYENLKNVKETRIMQKQKIPKELKKDFLFMTPLSWTFDGKKENIDFSDEATLDLTILQSEN
jgi:23S rRNA (guanine745-N1)-methyltransferase